VLRSASVRLCVCPVGILTVTYQGAACGQCTFCPGPCGGDVIDIVQSSAVSVHNDAITCLTAVREDTANSGVDNHDSHRNGDGGCRKQQPTSATFKHYRVILRLLFYVFATSSDSFVNVSEKLR